MATTLFFDEVIKDQGGKHTMELEFGRSSVYGNESIYIRVNEDTHVTVDRATAQRIAKAMSDLAAYIGVD